MIQMSVENFKLFLKEDKKDERTINDYVVRVERFLDYLNDVKKISIEKVQKQDLLDFFEYLKGKETSSTINRFTFAMTNYFKAANNQELYKAAGELNGQLSIEQYKLKDFLGVNKETIDKLANQKIRTANQMIEQGKTIQSRKQLSTETGISEEEILELVKLSNLARIGGLKSKRARLYYESGFDTIEKIAESTPDEIVKLQEKYVAESNFDGRASVLSEAEYSITLANYLPKIIEYEE